MRIDWAHLECWRYAGLGREGAFKIPHQPTNVTLRVIASSGLNWDHVSVSLKNRCPNWREMDFICRQFWNDEESVMQLHPPRSQWISNHPYCLHMWKPQRQSIPLPPSIMVGVKDVGDLSNAPTQVLEEVTALYAQESNA